MRRPRVALPTILLTLIPALSPADGHECDRGPIVEALTAQRAAFNTAIRDGDLATVEDVLAEDVVLVAGTHSDLFAGRAAQLEIWREEFDNGPDRFIYHRTPSCIRRSSVGPMAAERGRWRGEDPAGNFAAGGYSAKWRRLDGKWRLEAEVFMTEDCGGSGCPEFDNR